QVPAHHLVMPIHLVARHREHREIQQPAPRQLAPNLTQTRQLHPAPPSPTTPSAPTAPPSPASTNPAAHPAPAPGRHPPPSTPCAPCSPSSRPPGPTHC